LQDHLARSGAPQWLQRPESWLATASSLGLIIVLGRMLMKRSRELQAAAPPAPQVPSSRRGPSVGVFGLWTDALASQIPESDKERKEFGAILKQAGMYSPTARASVYAYRFLLLVFPLVCAGLIAVSSPREQTWKIMGLGGVAAAILSIIPRLYVWS